MLKASIDETNELLQNFTFELSEMNYYTNCFNISIALFPIIYVYLFISSGSFRIRRRNYLFFSNGQLRIKFFLTPSQAQQTNWNCSGKNIEKIKSNKLIDAKNIKYMIENICTI